MKNLLLVLIMLFSASIQAQEVALVSVYGTRIDADAEDPIKEVKNFIDNEDVAHTALATNMEAIQAELSKLFNLLPQDYKEESFYKYGLDEYESAPENVRFSLVGFDTQTGEDLKQDYRLSSHQVTFYEGYLAIGQGRPFKNDDAIKALFREIPTASAFMFLNFYPSVNFMGSPYGVGEAKANVSVSIQILDKNLKKIYNGKVSGSAPSKFTLGLNEFDETEVKESFDVAVQVLIENIEKKLAKKVAKIKW